MAQEQWIIKNKTKSCISFGDLPKLPAIWPGKVINLLAYYDKNTLNESDNLRTMINVGKVEFFKLNERGSL